MDIKVNIDAEAINKKVTDSILESAIGERLKEAIESQISDICVDKYNSPSVVTRIVKDIVTDRVRTIITEEKKDEIEKLVTEKLTEDIMSEIVNNAWDAYFKNRF